MRTFSSFPDAGSDCWVSFLPSATPRRWGLCLSRLLNTRVRSGAVWAKISSLPGVSGSRPVSSEAGLVGPAPGGGGSFLGASYEWCGITSPQMISVSPRLGKGRCHLGQRSPDRDRRRPRCGKSQLLPVLHSLQSAGVYQVLAVSRGLNMRLLLHRTCYIPSTDSH